MAKGSLKDKEIVVESGNLPIASLQKYEVNDNYEIVADEIVRTLVGSIGLILTVSITTLIAAMALEKKTKKI